MGTLYALYASPADIFHHSISVGAFFQGILLHFSIGPESGLANADWLKKLENCCLQVEAFFKIIQPNLLILLAVLTRDTVDHVTVSQTLPHSRPTCLLITHWSLL
jgi:hypothetical protein